MHHEHGHQSVKDRIIFATIECIEKEGLQSVTTRKIAHEADVNVAAINYYFGSKDNLLDEVFRARISHVFEDHIQEFQNSEHEITVESFKILITGMLNSMINYPNFTKALLHEPLFNNSYDDYTTVTFNNFLKAIENIIKKFIPEKTAIDVKLFNIHLMSSILMLGIMPDLFNEYLEDSFKKPEQQKKYIDQLFAALVQKPKHL